MNGQHGCFVRSRCDCTERHQGECAAPQPQIHSGEIISRHRLAGSFSDERVKGRLHRLDLAAEIPQRIDEVGTDSTPDAAAEVCVAPPVPGTSSIAAARTRIAY